MDMLTPMPKYTLFGFKNPRYADARIVVLPVPYDSATTYKSGAREGPHAIIDASRNMEYYSEELDLEINGSDIYTMDELEPDLGSPERMSARVEKEVGTLIDDAKVPLLIGGDHSIAIGSITAFGKRFNDFSVLHFDAHSDSREEYMGSRYCHACIMARARDHCDSCYSVGVRSIYKEGAELYGDDILFRKDMHGMSSEEIADKIKKKTKDRIYLTVDLDVLDPSEMPSTGTPEPDGLRFRELASILAGVLSEKSLIGMDFNELSPIGGFVAPNFLAAKLIFLTLCYAFYSKERRQPSSHDKGI